VALNRLILIAEVVEEENVRSISPTINAHDKRGHDFMMKSEATLVLQGTERPP
jgi:hypothetical protein